MKRLIFLLLCFLSISQIVYGENELVRKSFDLKLLIDNDTFYKATVPQSSYVLNGNLLQIYPGEDLLFEAEVEKDKIVRLTAVRENKFPEKTIEIKFEQVCDGLIHKSMMLSIKNPFNKDLNYEALIYLMKNKKWVSTSILPVLAGKQAFETWPDIIVSIALNNFTLKE
jgi:hypothetical protein